MLCSALGLGRAGDLKKTARKRTQAKGTLTRLFGM